MFHTSQREDVGNVGRVRYPLFPTYSPHYCPPKTYLGYISVIHILRLLSQHDDHIFTFENLQVLVVTSSRVPWSGNDHTSVVPEDWTGWLPPHPEEQLRAATANSKSNRQRETILGTLCMAP